MNKKLPKWTSVYPQGTKEGNEEQKFFIALARHPKFEWRSTAMIVKESGLTRERVEEIIQKYVDMGIVISASGKDDHWAYWERVPNLLKKDNQSLTAKDQSKRIDKQIQS